MPLVRQVKRSLRHRPNHRRTRVAARFPRHRHAPIQRTSRHRRRGRVAHPGARVARRPTAQVPRAQPEPRRVAQRAQKAQQGQRRGAWQPEPQAVKQQPSQRVPVEAQAAAAEKSNPELVAPPGGQPPPRCGARRLWGVPPSPQILGWRLRPA